jgi:hypothetical protein
MKLLHDLSINELCNKCYIFIDIDLLKGEYRARQNSGIIN